MDIYIYIYIHTHTHTIWFYSKSITSDSMRKGKPRYG